MSNMHSIEVIKSEGQERVEELRRSWVNLGEKQTEDLIAKGIRMAHNILSRSGYVPEPRVEAEEVAYRCYHNCIKTGTSPANYMAYYSRAVRNECYTVIKHYQRTVVHSDEVVIKTNPYNDLEEKDVTDKMLNQAIGRLNPSEQQIIRLYYYKGLSYEQIASEMDITLRAVEGRLHRARIKLFDLLESNQNMLRDAYYDTLKRNNESYLERRLLGLRDELYSIERKILVINNRLLARRLDTVNGKEELEKLIVTGTEIAFNILRKSRYVPEPSITARDVAYQIVYEHLIAGCSLPSLLRYPSQVISKSFKVINDHKQEATLNTISEAKQKNDGQFM